MWEIISNFVAFLENLNFKVPIGKNYWDLETYRNNLEYDYYFFLQEWVEIKLGFTMMKTKPFDI